MSFVLSIRFKVKFTLYDTNGKEADLVLHSTQLEVGAKKTGGDQEVPDHQYDNGRQHVLLLWIRWPVA
jgi:hypothetical protein